MNVSQVHTHPMSCTIILMSLISVSKKLRENDLDSRISFTLISYCPSFTHENHRLAVVTVRCAYQHSSASYMSLARSPWSEPDPASEETSSWLENVVVTIVFLTAFYCCCRNCVHATFDFVRCCGHCCVRLCRCCICSEESAEDSTSRPRAASDYESLDEEIATPAAAPTSAACGQAGPSSASTPSAAPMAQRMDFRDQVLAGESGSEALPVAQGFEVAHVVHTNEVSLPMSRYQPPRAKVLPSCAISHDMVVSCMARPTLLRNRRLNQTCFM